MLEGFLDVKRTEINLVELWERNPPPEAKKRSLAELIRMVSETNLISSLQVAKVMFPFLLWNRLGIILSTMMDTTSSTPCRAELQRPFSKKVYVPPHMQYIWYVTQL